MSVTVTTTKRTQRVLIDLGRHPEFFKKGIREGLFDIGEITRKEVVRLITTGSRTGRMYKRPGRPDHQASAPGEPPAKDTGALDASVEYVVRDLEMEIGDEVPYGKFLENGTRKMRGPRPHLIVAVNNTSGDAVRILHNRVKERLSEK